MPRVLVLAEVLGCWAAAHQVKLECFMTSISSSENTDCVFFTQISVTFGHRSVTFGHSLVEHRFRPTDCAQETQINLRETHNQNPSR